MKKRHEADSPHHCLCCNNPNGTIMIPITIHYTLAGYVMYGWDFHLVGYNNPSCIPLEPEWN